MRQHGGEIDKPGGMIDRGRLQGRDLVLTENFSCDLSPRDSGA